MIGSLDIMSGPVGATPAPSMAHDKSRAVVNRCNAGPYRSVAPVGSNQSSYDTSSSDSSPPQGLFTVSNTPSVVGVNHNVGLASASSTALGFVQPVCVFEATGERLAPSPGPGGMPSGPPGSWEVRSDHQGYRQEDHPVFLGLLAPWAGPRVA